MNTTPGAGHPIVVTAASPADTLAVARRLASLLRPGDVVLLTGRLGAGKTLFAGGVAEGLGVTDRVVSPTFVLVRRYEGFLPIYHADVYRLGSMGEFEDLDLPDTAADGVLLVEWGEAVAAAVPADHLVVAIDVADDTTRTLTFSPQGAWRERRLEELAA